MAVQLRLKELREAKGWRQIDVATKFEKPIDPARVSRWENGVEVPRVETLVELARIFGCQLGELFMSPVYIQQ